MPTVTRAERRVSRTAMPGARLTAAETAISQGAGVEQAKGEVGRSIAGLGAQGVQAGATLFYRAEQERRREAEEARQRADTLAVIDAESRLAAAERDFIYKPGDGVLARRGETALGAPEEVRTWFDKTAGEIESKLGNDEQKAAFHRIRAGRGQQIDLTVARHVDGEIKSVFAEKTKASVDTHTDLAIANALDPTRADMELRSAERSINAAATTLGWPPEQREATLTAARAKVAQGQIDMLLATGQTKAATVVFEEAKAAGVLGDKTAAIERALKEGTTRERAQQETAKILATAGGDLAQARELAKGIDDPDVQDAVLQRVEHEHSVRKTLDREQEETTLKGVANILDRTKNVNAVPPKVWSELDPSQRSAFRSYAKQLTEQGEVVNDPVEYYRLRSMSVDPNPAVREQFKNLRLTDYIAKLGKTQFETMVDLQTAMKAGNIKAEQTISDGFLTNEGVVNNALLGAGIDSSPNPKTDAAGAKFVADFKQEVDRQVSALHVEKPTNEQIQKIVDDLLTSKVTQKGSWSGLITSEPFRDVSKRNFELLREIPANRMRQIHEALRAQGKAVTTDNVLKVWAGAPAELRK